MLKIEGLGDHAILRELYENEKYQYIRLDHVDDITKKLVIGFRKSSQEDLLARIVADVQAAKIEDFLIEKERQEESCFGCDSSTSRISFGFFS